MSWMAHRLAREPFGAQCSANVQIKLDRFPRRVTHLFHVQFIAHKLFKIGMQFVARHGHRLQWLAHFDALRFSDG